MHRDELRDASHHLEQELKDMRDEVQMLQSRGSGGGGGGGGGGGSVEVGGVTRGAALTMVADLMKRLGAIENAL